MSSELSASSFPIDQCLQALSDVTDIVEMNYVCSLFAEISTDTCYKFPSDFAALADAFYKKKAEKVCEMTTIIAALTQQIPPENFHDIASLTNQIVKLKKLSFLISETQTATLDDLFNRLGLIIKRELPDQMANFVYDASRAEDIEQLAPLSATRTLFYELLCRYHIFPDDEMTAFNFQIKEIEKLFNQLINTHLSTCNHETSQLQKRVGTLDPLSIALPKKFFGVCTQLQKLWAVQNFFPEKQGEISAMQKQVVTYVTDYVSYRDQQFDLLTINDLKKLPNYVKKLVELIRAAEIFLPDESLETLLQIFIGLQSWTDSLWGNSPKFDDWKDLINALLHCIEELSIYYVEMNENRGFIVVDWKAIDIDIENRDEPALLRILQVLSNWTDDLMRKNQIDVTTNDNEREVGKAERADGEAWDH